MTPEGKVKHGVKAYLAMIGAYWFMPVQMGMGAPSLDFLVCYKGRFFAIETKVGNKGMTPRQRLTATQMGHAGAIVILVNESASIREQLDPYFLPEGSPM